MHLVLTLAYTHGVDPKDIINQVMKLGYTVVDYKIQNLEAAEKAKQIIDLWNKLRPGQKPLRHTQQRISKVRARLEDGFTMEELCLVVTRLAESPFHNGANDRQWSAPGPEWVLHSTEKVEQWLSRKPETPQSYADQVKAYFA